MFDNRLFFPTAKELQEARCAGAPLTVDQMVKRIADEVRLNYKTPELYSVNVKFPEFGPFGNKNNRFDVMFNQVLNKIPSHYGCEWVWIENALTFCIKWK